MFCDQKFGMAREESLSMSQVKHLKVLGRKAYTVNNIMLSP